VGIGEPALWLAVCSGVGALARLAYHVIIFYLAVRGARPAERRAIIESLAKTRQFGAARRR
jgi:hypothetical protein